MNCRTFSQYNPRTRGKKATTTKATTYYLLSPRGGRRTSQEAYPVPCQSLVKNDLTGSRSRFCFSRASLPLPLLHLPNAFLGQLDQTSSHSVQLFARLPTQALYPLTLILNPWRSFFHFHVYKSTAQRNIRFVSVVGMSPAHRSRRQRSSKPNKQKLVPQHC